MSIYWEVAEEADGHAQVFGVGTTASVIDDADGGVIYYTHIDRAPELIALIKGENK